ncbi:MAG: prolipoprotein diacylglyceryl transferase [Lachnospiraceae bacterium]|jgi:phosphatidylglycerol:prolipoprotein diacylglycerol transferase|nr:prolipoprotein diacylglyceryl transferase [Lachnospiraceae bacterium]
MENTIIFPNLHITLTNVGKSISVFGFEIAFYGIIIAIGMILGSSIIMKNAKKQGYKEDDFLDIIIWSLVLGVIGARAYYVVFSWNLYKNDLLSIFNLRQGGLAIYGGILAGILTAFIVCKLKKIPFLKAADVCILGLPVGQAIGRWGNFFNREAFGDYTNNLFAMQIPLSRVRTMDDVSQTMLDHVQTIGNTAFISVNPTFLYESVWSVGVFIFLMIMRRHLKFNGEAVLLYLITYGAGRFWIEGLRTDQLILFNTGIPVSQLLAACLVAFGFVMLLIGFNKGKKSKGKYSK